MRILHLCLGDRFADGFNYQVNSLVKFHKKMGLEVEVIASCNGFDTSGRETDYLNPGCYIGECNIPITRIPYKRNNSICHKLRLFVGLEKELERVSPDIMFIHNLQFADVPIVVKYLKKHTNVISYADNHADFSNSATNWFSRNILHRVIWKYYAQSIAPYLRKIYGVLPARVTFLTEVYELPEEKCELLVMGADDELVKEATNIENISKIRSKYEISEHDLLIVTGGKINRYRPETLQLMEAVIESTKTNIKLLVFGNVEETLKSRFDEMCKCPKIIYAGWQDAKGTYSLMAAANLVVFPGLHSVMWEQAVALGVPCIFRDIEGFHHVDLGGNAIFLKDVSKESLQKEIESLSLDKDKLRRMRFVAKEKGMKTFSYYEIARCSIEIEGVFENQKEKENVIV